MEHITIVVCIIIIDFYGLHAATSSKHVSKFPLIKKKIRFKGINQTKYNNFHVIFFLYFYYSTTKKKKQSC